MPGRERRIVYVTLGGEGLSRRRRAVSWLLAVALVVLVGLGSTYAGAAPILTGRPVLQAAPTTASTPYTLDGLPTECHPTTHTGWRGAAYTTVEVTVVGNRIVSPGDHVTCLFTVPNTGPSSAILSVAFRAEEPAVGPANPDLPLDVDLVWDVAGTTGTMGFDQAITLGEHVVAEVPVSQGAVTPILVGFDMPVGTTADTRAGQDSTVLSFDVLVMLRGAEQTPDEAPTASPPAPQPASSVLAAGRWPRSPLASTGLEAAIVVGAALALVLAGTVAWVVARRRRDRTQ